MTYEIWRYEPPTPFSVHPKTYALLSDNEKRACWSLPPLEDAREEKYARLCEMAGVKQPDPVNSPSHYNTGGIECFDAMSAMLTREEMIGYLRGNSFKYRWRFRHKGGAEDLRKAEWYEKKLLDLIENSA